MGDQMRAWVFTSTGPIEKSLKLLENVPQPPQSLKKNQILVKVASAGLNPADYKTPEAGFLARAVTKFPRIAGVDFSGHAVAVGEDVVDIKPGDAVFGAFNVGEGEGSLAQYIITQSDGCVGLPENIELDKAAGVGTAAMTAYQAIVPNAKAGDKIFINGGSGGTGTFGIQIAKAVGCHVTVSCSTSKIALCEELGADLVIDYKTTDVTEKLRAAGRVYSLVVDNVGTYPPDLYTAGDGFLLPQGKYVRVGMVASFAVFWSLVRSLLLPSFLGGINYRAEMVRVQKRRDDLMQIAQWMADGKVKTVIDTIFEFDDLPRAFEQLRKGNCTGKVVVHVSRTTS